jgi:hypothetical protein
LKEINRTLFHRAFRLARSFVSRMFIEPLNSLCVFFLGFMQQYGTGSCAGAPICPEHPKRTVGWMEPQAESDKRFHDAQHRKSQEQRVAPGDTNVGFRLRLHPTYGSSVGIELEGSDQQPFDARQYAPCLARGRRP